MSTNSLPFLIFPWPGKKCACLATTISEKEKTVKIQKLCEPVAKSLITEIGHSGTIFTIKSDKSTNQKCLFFSSFSLSIYHCPSFASCSQTETLDPKKKLSVSSCVHWTAEKHTNIAFFLPLWIHNFQQYSPAFYFLD